MLQNKTREYFILIPVGMVCYLLVWADSCWFLPVAPGGRAVLSCETSGREVSTSGHYNAVG